MRYRRANTAGGTYFFTVNLAERSADTLVRHIADLREVMSKVKTAHPFSIVAMVVLPEHLHAIWRMPPGDVDYPKRWSLLKAGFSRKLEQSERLLPSRVAKRERAFGNAGIGSIKFAMKLTWRGTWITSITTR